MRVLLIEDDSATARSVSLMLKSEGFNVYTTDLGEEGIDLSKVYDDDIILLDLNLPDMSGFEALRSLRASRVKTPTLILSGLAGIEDKTRVSASAPTTIRPSPSTRTNWWRASTRSCAAPGGTPSPWSSPAIWSSTSTPRRRRSTRT